MASSLAAAGAAAFLAFFAYLAGAAAAALSAGAAIGAAPACDAACTLKDMAAKAATISEARVLVMVVFFRAGAG